MCLILLANQYSPDFKLVLLSNRDEYHHRDASAAHYWPGSPNIFGGIDNKAKGSWLAVDTSGRFAAVTNIRKGRIESPKKYSRGLLVNDFLQQQIPAQEFIDNLRSQNDNYSPFNILLMDASGLWHYSSDTKVSTPVEVGLHGLSNATLNTPWPKVTKGIDLLKECFNNLPLSKARLLSCIASQQQADEKDLPNTGIDIDFERFLSSQFIISKEYGTRCTTLITIDHNDTLEFEEISFNAQGHIESTVKQSIQITN